MKEGINKKQFSFNFKMTYTHKKNMNKKKMK